VDSRWALAKRKKVEVNQYDEILEVSGGQQQGPWMLDALMNLFF